MNTLSEAKQARLRALSTKDNIIAAMAIDQRGSLRQMMIDAGGPAADAHIAEFKSAVVAALTPYASAVLIDPEIGLSAASRRAPGCGLLLAYEMDGYNNPRPHRMLAWALAFSMAVFSAAESGQSKRSALLMPTSFTGLPANIRFTSALAAVSRLSSTPCLYLAEVRSSTPNAFALVQLAIMVGMSQSAPH